jgi:hypothetical protein
MYMPKATTVLVYAKLYMKVHTASRTREYKMPSGSSLFNKITVWSTILLFSCSLVLAPSLQSSLKATMALLANLRDEASFPTFKNCPSEHEIDFEYYHSSDGSLYTPSRHWCLLGKITSMTWMGRLLLEVEDKAGSPLLVHFHLELGDTVDMRAFVIGRTVVILYPHRYEFSTFTTGLCLRQAVAIQASLIQVPQTSC